jgi:tetratricopeptide (TPR) repeat protein
MDDDPVRLLHGYSWTFDPDTLREVLDEADTALFERIRAGLTTMLAAAGDDRARAELLSLRAGVSRSLGDLKTAVADGERALTLAEASGDVRHMAIVRVRVAHVRQWRGEFAEADRLFALADAPGLPDALHGFVHQHTGKNLYDQGRYREARDHFERALELRRGGDPDLRASTGLALAAVSRRLLRPADTRPTG